MNLPTNEALLVIIHIAYKKQFTITRSYLNYVNRFARDFFGKRGALIYSPSNLVKLRLNPLKSV